jgi:hypothetical protein
VGVSDFLLLKLSFGSQTGGPGWNPAVDASGDGSIGIEDFLAFRKAYGSPPGPSGLACAGSIPCLSR